MPFLIELWMMSVNINKSVSAESTFTGMQGLISDIFLFKGFKTIFILLDETSWKCNIFANLQIYYIFLNAHVVFIVSQ